MPLNPNIILAGSQPDFVNTLARSTQAAGLANQNQRQNALSQLYQEQGPGILAGEQNALNAYSRQNPEAALGIQQVYRANAQQDEQSARARQAHQLKIEEYARGLSREQAEREAIEVQNGLKRGISLFQSGDLNGLNGLLQSVGEQPLQSLDQFPAVASLYGDVLKTLQDVTSFTNPKPADEYGRYAAEEIAAGREPRSRIEFKRAGQEREAKPSETDKKLARLQEAYPELPFQQIVDVADGVLRVSRDPFTDEIQIVNVLSGDVSSPSASQQDVDEVAGTAPEANESRNFGKPFQGAEDAFGLGGMARKSANAVSDFVAGAQVFPETAQAQQDFTVLREDLTNDMQSAYDQRVPAWLLRDIKELTPQAGGLTGPEAAKNKLVSLGRRFQDELKAAKRSGLGRGVSPEMRAESASRISSIERALQRVESALSGFEGGDTQQTSGGVQWRIVE